MKVNDHSLYKSCIFENKKGGSFSKARREPKTAKLELIHADICRPSIVAFLDGFNYYVTFIDDSSRKMWVHFFRNKFDVFEIFKRWKAMVENETNLKVKCVWYDNE